MATSRTKEEKRKSAIIFTMVKLNVFSSKLSPCDNFAINSFKGKKKVKTPRLQGTLTIYSILAFFLRISAT